MTAVSTAGMTRVDASVREETGGGQKPAQVGEEEYPEI